MQVTRHKKGFVVALTPEEALEYLIYYTDGETAPLIHHALECAGVKEQLVLEKP